MLHRFSLVLRAGPLCLGLVPTLIRAQDPVVKPRTTATTTYRLAAPAVVVAGQLPDGRIEVRWGRVEGAAAYRISRSVPGLQAEQPIAPDVRDTSYTDGDVRAGFPYYYLIAAVNEAGQIGLKRGAAPVKATVSAGATPATTPSPTFAAPPVNPRATLSPTLAGATLQWQMTQAGVYAVVERSITPSGGAAGAWKAVNRSGIMTPTALGPLSSATVAAGDAFGTLPAGTTVLYRVHNVSGTDTTIRSADVLSNPLVIPSTTTGTTQNAPGPASAGSTTFVVGPPLSVAVGATASLASIAGAGTRWVSMDERIATVDANGMVTGRASGATSIVALTGATDGTLRVATARVTVSP